MASREDMIRKVQALLSRAGNAGTEAESNACALKARELMLKYKLEESEVNPTDKTSEAVKKRVPFVSTRIQIWETDLAISISEFFDTRVLVNKVARVFTFVGIEDNVDLAIFALEQMRNRFLLKLEESRRLRPSWQNPKTFRTSFLLGLSVGFRSTLQKAHDDTPTESFGLVRLDNQVAEEGVAKFFPYATMMQMDTTYGSREGFDSGRTTGSQMSLRTGVNG